MLQKLSLADLDVAGKRVLMRVDFNVPLKGGQITDDTRIAAALPSIEYVLKKGGALILMSHLGRPKDKEPEFSLAPCAKRLAEMLHKPVALAPDCVGPEVEAMVNKLKPGKVILLENLRFHKGEEHPDEEPGFVQELAKLGDMYVNDAFGTAHRKHASTEAIAHLFPDKAAAGFLMEKEIQFLGNALLEPTHPFYAIIGGAKISSKLGVLQSLVKKADALLIGGAMAYTFLKAQGISVGNSLVEEEFLPKAKELIELCRQKKKKLLLPIDHVVAEKVAEGVPHKTVDSIPAGFQGVDIGPKTVSLFLEQIQDAHIIFWNGPLGVCEIFAFAAGTKAIAQALASLPAITVVGGGDSIAALQAVHLTEKVSHVSTGGGASLEFIEFGKLPGIEALTDKIEEVIEEKEDW